MDNIIFLSDWKEEKDMLDELIRDLQERGYTENDVAEASKRVLEYFDIDQVPVPIVSIAKKLGFRVYQQDMEDEMSGYIAVSKKWEEKFGTDKLVIVNAEHSMGHKRFTIAHELCHYLLDYKNRNKPYYDAYYSYLKNEPREKRANQFAASLLMPELQFIDEFNIAKKTNCNVIAVLADKFGVSAKAIETRMEELKLDKE